MLSLQRSKVLLSSLLVTPTIPHHPLSEWSHLPGTFCASSATLRCLQQWMPKYYAVAVGTKPGIYESWYEYSVAIRRSPHSAAVMAHRSLLCSVRCLAGRMLRLK